MMGWAVTGGSEAEGWSGTAALSLRSPLRRLLPGSGAGGAVLSLRSAAAGAILTFRGAAGAGFAARELARGACGASPLPSVQRSRQPLELAGLAEELPSLLLQLVGDVQQLLRAGPPGAGRAGGGASRAGRRSPGGSAGAVAARAGAVLLVHRFSARRSTDSRRLFPRTRARRGTRACARPELRRRSSRAPVRPCGAGCRPRPSPARANRRRRHAGRRRPADPPGARRAALPRPLPAAPSPPPSR